MGFDLKMTLESLLREQQFILSERNLDVCAAVADMVEGVATA